MKSKNVSIVLSRENYMQAERIIEGGEELFLKAGIKSVTMDDIAKHLGMSKKTIYQFFKDKNELVIALVKKKLKDDEDQICSIIGQSANVIEEMINMMKASEEMFARINPIVIHDMQKYHPDAWKLFQNFKADVLIHTLEELLTKGIEQGYIRPDVNVKILARMRVSQVEMGFDTRIFPISDFSTWKVQYQFLEHFNYGICTLKGWQALGLRLPTATCHSTKHYTCKPNLLRRRAYGRPSTYLGLPTSRTAYLWQTTTVPYIVCCGCNRRSYVYQKILLLQALIMTL